MGVSNAWAVSEGSNWYDANSAKVYFDNTNSSYSNVSLLIGRQWNYNSDGVGSSGVNFSLVSGTNNLYYASVTFYKYTTMCFINATNWGWEGSKVTARCTYATDGKYTNTSNDNLSNTTHLYVPASGNANANLTHTTLTSYTALNYTQTLEQHLSTNNGSTFTASTVAIATVKVSSNKLKSDNATEASSGTIASGSSSATCSAARTATVTYTVGSIAAGYTFVGWYDGNTQKSTSETYTYNATGAKTITARFQKEPTYEVTISAGNGGTVTPNSSQQVGSTGISIKATANTGFKFKNWTKTGGVTIANANNATTTITATATGTVKANFEEDLTSTWHIVGDPTSIFKGTSTWAAHNDNMLKKTTGASAASKGSLTVDVAALPASESSYQFKVLNTNGTKWYGWSNETNNHFWVNQTITTGVYNADNNNLYFIPNALGEYKFAVDWSSSNPSLTVTFPTAYAVTFGKGTGGSTVTAKYNSTSFNSETKVQQGKTVTFTQSASTGYTFKEWNTKADGTGTKLSAEATYTHTVTTSNNVYAVYTQNPDRIIYLEPTGFWDSNNPKYVAHVWGAGEEDITMTGVGEAPYKYYTCDVPAKYTNIVFYRKSTDGSTIWNQTADLTLPNKSTALYTIKSTATPSEGEWKEANLVYTITLGSSMFGPYGISYNGQSYFSKDDANVVISLPYGATINFIEGQPYSDIYTGGIMEKDKTRQFDLTQPYTIERDIRFDANYVTKVQQIAYLGVPNNNCDWDKNASYANFIWRFDSYYSFPMTNSNDKAEFAFEEDGVKYYKFTIPAGCNKFQIQRKQARNDDNNNQNQTHSHTCDHEYMVLNAGVNCYMLNEGTFNSNTHTGYWCALPAREGDYRLLYVEQVVEKDANGYTIITRKKAHPSDIIRKGTDRQIVSLHTYKERTYTANAGGGLTYESSNNPEIILQKYIGNNQWQDVECQMVYGPIETIPAMGQLPGRKNASPGSDIDDLKYHNGIENIKNDTHEDQGNGVWNFFVTQDGAGNASVQWNQTQRYTGEYYIRTNAAFGAWNSYKGSDNHMTRSDVSKRNSNYSHYYCKWIDQVGTNVTYTIANDYGMAISDTLTADETDIWGTPIADAQKIVTGETLPTNNEYGGANVRFSWNEKSNFLHRAYLAGSTDVSSRFLVLEGQSGQLYDAEGQALTQGANGSDRYGLKANEEIFTDISNWVYYADVQLVPNAGLKLTAKYMDKVQYFIGQADQYNNTILKGEGDDKYLIRLLYDFKTNELISAYVPGGQEGKEIEAIETNLMLLRKENDTPRQLSFNENNMKDVGKQAYGVLELTQATLEDNTKNVYVRSLYWISFPFDVRITDVFGFGEYGKHWIIQSYDGAKRAANGLWADSETNWVYHFDPNTLNAGTSDQGIMKRGVGYVVALNLNNIKADNLFVGRITTLALYFPSTTTITGHIVNTDAVSISVPKHECTINRLTPDGDRRVKDSHWNVIGVPSYINAVGDFTGKISTIAEDVKFYYSWQGDYDKYEVVSGKSGVSFNSLNAYMVQFAGNLQWTNVLNEAPAGMAAKRNSDNMQEHHLCLELQQNDNEQDRTFIQLQEDEVTTAFDFNYDLCKIINKGANIYSLIATDRDPIEVAGNVLPVGEAIIPLGIQLDAAGEYTFAMPDGTDGITVELIDYENNTRTNMLLDDYTVNLTAGTNEARFALHVKPDKTATNVEHITTPSCSDIRKFIIDGVLYMQKDGILYDAQGKLVR